MPRDVSNWNTWDWLYNNPRLSRRQVNKQKSLTMLFFFEKKKNITIEVQQFTPSHYSVRCVNMKPSENEMLATTHAFRGQFPVTLLHPWFLKLLTPLLHQPKSTLQRKCLTPQLQQQFVWFLPPIIARQLSGSSCRVCQDPWGQRRRDGLGKDSRAPVVGFRPAIE